MNPAAPVTNARIAVVSLFSRTYRPSVSASALDDRAQSLDDDQNVADHRPVVDIRKVQADSLFPRQIRPSAHLPETRDTGLDEQPPLHIVVVCLDLTPQRRSGSGAAHLPPEHVDELRQLVDAEPAQDPTDRRDPRVVLDL